MSQIVIVTVKCYKASVDPPRLVTLLDAFLQEQGYEVRDFIVRIEEEEDANQAALDPPGQS